MSLFTLKNGEKLYYEDMGQGTETLIMMHGWTSSHDIYVKPSEMLESRARCIIYDHRGHGGSKAGSHCNQALLLSLCKIHRFIQS